MDGDRASNAAVVVCPLIGGERLGHDCNPAYGLLSIREMHPCFTMAEDDSFR